MNKILDRLRKIKELADRGEMGEAITANEKLQDGLKKAGLKLEDLENKERSNRVFKYFYKDEKTIIFQIVMKVLDKKALNFTSYTNSKKIGVDLSDLEYYEVQSMIGFYIPLYRKEIKTKMESLKQAFIQKHTIFPESRSDKKNKQEKPLTEKEISEIISMMNSLDDKKYYKQLMK